MISIMLSRRDYERIIREMDSVGGDALAYLRESSPWFNVLEPPIIRLSETLSRLNLTHVLYGLRVLPLYGVPHIFKEIFFAVRVEDFGELLKKLSDEGFMKLSSNDESTLLDLQNNRVIHLLSRPKPLNWSDKLIERLDRRYGVNLLSVEDYIIYLLLLGKVSHIELAAKVLYVNRGSLDRGYLREVAANYGVEEILEKILAELGI